MTTDNVDHPPHYTKHPSGVECIDIAELLSFNLGNALKYVWRAKHKGREEEDLKKALWYVRREQRLTGISGEVSEIPVTTFFNVQKALDAEDKESKLYAFLVLLITFNADDDYTYEYMLSGIEEILEEEEEDT